MSQMENYITKTLFDALKPSALQVINESHSHNVPANSETHFKVVCVSSVFVGERSVKRHQRVYGLLAQALSSGVHALSLHLYTDEEWQKKLDVPQSPECLGGSKA